MFKKTTNSSKRKFQRGYRHSICIFLIFSIFLWMTPGDAFGTLVLNHGGQPVDFDEVHDFGLITAAFAILIVAAAYRVATGEIDKTNVLKIGPLEIKSHINTKTSGNTSFNNTIESPAGFSSVGEDYSLTTNAQGTTLALNAAAFADVMSEPDGDFATFSGAVETTLFFEPQATGSSQLALEVNIGNTYMGVYDPAMPLTAAAAGFRLLIDSPELGVLFDTDAMLAMQDHAEVFTANGDISSSAYVTTLAGDDTIVSLNNYNDTILVPLQSDMPFELRISYTQEGFSQVVPEPATICLLALGGLVLRRKRRAC